MDNTRILSIIAITLVVIVIPTLIVNMSIDQMSDTEDLKIDFEYSSDVELAIFGNANGDSTIDSKDVDLLISLIKKDTVYNPKLHSFADTNADGVLNKDDIDQLCKIINKEECRIAYWANDSNVGYVNFPLMGKIAIHNIYPADICTILGVYEDIVGMTNGGFMTDIAKDNNRYPGIQSVTNIGNPDRDPEKLFTTEASIFITSSGWKDYSKVIEMYEAAGKPISILKVNINQYYSDGPNLIGTIKMLGFMMQREDRVASFMAEMKAVISYMDAYNPTTLGFVTPSQLHENTVMLDACTSNGDSLQDFFTISMMPLTNVNPITDSVCPEVSLETILNINPDIIFLMDSSRYDSVEKRENAIQQVSSYFYGTKAYNNGEIYFLNYDEFNSVGGFFMLPYICSCIYPSEYNQDQGLVILQRYYEQWTNYQSFDQNEVGDLIPYRIGTI